MMYTDKKILSLSAVLLLCFGTLSLSAPPDGKGKPGGGNQPLDATARFYLGDIISNGLEDGKLQGELVTGVDFDVLEGQLLSGETISVGGDAGEALAVLGSSVLPVQGVDIQPGMVIFDVASGVSWKIRLDRDKEPSPRAQFYMSWLDAAGNDSYLRIGWVTAAYEGEKYPLDPLDYGTSSSPSLESTTIIFGEDGTPGSDPFRIQGSVEVPGKGKKTKFELEVFSRYGELYDENVAPWCNMGIETTPPAPCVASTRIDTELAN